jgi:hypothetical protein
MVTASGSALGADLGTLERMRTVGEAQVGVQATYAASLDAQAVGLLAVDIALIGVLAAVRVSTVALPPHWALALVPLGISAVLAMLAASVVGAPAMGADLVEVLIYQDSHGPLPPINLAELLARRAIQAREENFVHLSRKRRLMSFAVLALIAAWVLVGGLAATK